MITNTYIIEKETRYEFGSIEKELIFLDTCILKESVRQLINETLKVKKGMSENFEEITKLHNTDIDIENNDIGNVIDFVLSEYMKQKHRVVRKLPVITVSRYYKENINRNTYITLSLKLREYRYDKEKIKDKVNVMVRSKTDHTIIDHLWCKNEKEFNTITEQYSKTNSYLLVDFSNRIEMDNIEKIEINFSENEIVLKTTNNFFNSLDSKTYLLYKKDHFNDRTEIIKESFTKY